MGQRKNKHRAGEESIRGTQRTWKARKLSGEKTRLNLKIGSCFIKEDYTRTLFINKLWTVDFVQPHICHQYGKMKFIRNYCPHSLI